MCIHRHLLRVFLFGLICIVSGAKGLAAEEELRPHPDLCPLVATFIERDYYDTSRIDPRGMLTEAMRTLENSHVAIDAEIGDVSLSLHFGAEEHLHALPGLNDIQAVMQVLQEVQQDLLASSLWDLEEGSGLVYAMLNGALRTLDPHTVVFPPRRASAFKEEVIEGEFFGIGAYLSMEEGLISIERVMPGLPADMAGVRDGDVILRIDGVTAAGLSLPEAVRRIKGPKGTKVSLLVRREDSEEEEEVVVVRDKVKEININSWRSGTIGYVRMNEFDGNTFEDLRKELHRLKYGGEAPLQGLVLDLRFNGGGRLDQARLISDLFLPDHREVVRTVRLGARPDIHFTQRSVLMDVPMMVMISGSSASAAEILSGALQTNERAVVVGQTSFGKGSVQTWRKLPDASYIKYTIQEYQLRGGQSIQGHGVQPDLALARFAQTDDGRIDLVPFSQHREADAEFALIGDDSYQYQPEYQLNWYQPNAEDEERERFRISHPDFVPDPEAQLVMDLLADALAPLHAAAQGRGLYLDREQLLAALQAPLAARQQAEHLRLAEAFAAQQRGIEWHEAARASVDPGHLRFAPIRPEPVQAGSITELPITVFNDAAQVAPRLYAVVDADSGSPFWEGEVVFGDVPAGGSQTGSLHLEIPPRMPSGLERFELVLHQSGNDAELGRVEVELDILGQPRPVLNASWQLQRSDALALDQERILELHIRNDGQAASAPLVLFVRKDDDPFVQLGGARWELDSLEVGEDTVVELPFSVQSQLSIGSGTQDNPHDAVVLILHVEERFEDDVSHYLAERFNHKLVMPLGDPVPLTRVSKPVIDLQGQQQEDGMLQLDYQVRGEELRHLAIFRGEEKVVLHHLAGADAHQFSDRIELEPGMNQVRILVVDEREQSRVLVLRCFAADRPASELAQGEAEQAPALPVDLP